MIIGNGQLAKAFNGLELQNVVIFASGVPNSNCTDEAQFERERKLLTSVMKAHPHKTLVYFSSCALSSEAYPKNRYYQHKEQMEVLVKTSSEYFIFRIPQLFGELKNHNTLINYLYFKIINKEPFTIYNDAYRYVIDIEDVVRLVSHYITSNPMYRAIDIANPHRYSVVEIVEILEALTNCKANYGLVDKSDGYMLDLERFKQFVNQSSYDFGFGEDYLYTKLKIRVECRQGDD